MYFPLFIATTLIWGTTWLAIKFQLGTVNPLWSLTYRFALSSLVLMIVGFLTKQSMKFTRKQHIWIALQGVLLFSVNYSLFYFGSAYFVSGIVAVLFASISIMNIFNSRLFLRTPISSSALLGSLLGIIGLLCIFSTEVTRLWEKDWSYITQGLCLCLAGTLCASFGQITAAANMRRSLPVLQVNALGMGYGAMFTAAIALASGIMPTFDYAFPYISSLLYLSLVGTVLAFGAYLRLVHQIGPSKASYAFILIPLVALIISSIFEEFDWDIYSASGVALILVGNIIVLSRNLDLSFLAKIFKIQEESPHT